MGGTFLKRGLKRTPRAHLLSPQVHQLERTAQTVTDVSAPLVSERMCVRGDALLETRALTPPAAQQHRR